MQAGLDEAGRGPVVGPLVVGLVAAPEERDVAALGVRDSKTLTAPRRTELAEAIRRAARVEILGVTAPELDARMRRQNLNEIELDLFAKLGSRVKASTYFLDACDVDAKRFGASFAARLGRSPAPAVVSEHRADARYPLVSAASIVAKVARDEAVAGIARRLEPEVGLRLGSGYASDPDTIRFLMRYLEFHGRLPADARASWATSKGLMAARAQRTLSGF